jgi:hypothetical protein
MKVVRLIESNPTGEGDRPVKEVRVNECGSRALEKDEQFNARRTAATEPVSFEDKYPVAWKRMIEIEKEREKRRGREKVQSTTKSETYY